MGRGWTHLEAGIPRQPPYSPCLPMASVHHMSYHYVSTVSSDPPRPALTCWVPTSPSGTQRRPAYQEPWRNMSHRQGHVIKGAHEVVGGGLVSHQDTHHGTGRGHTSSSYSQRAFPGGWKGQDCRGARFQDEGGANGPVGVQVALWRAGSG